MSKTESISTKKNFMYNIIYETFTIISPIFTIPYISRIFGPEKLGIYSYTNTIALYFALFALLGLKNYGSRIISSVRDNATEVNKKFCELFYLQIALGIIVLIAFLCYSFLFHTEYQQYNFILILVVASSLFDVNWYLNGMENFKLIVLRSSFIKILSLISIFIFIKTENDLWIYTLIFSLSTLLSVLSVWPIILRQRNLERVSVKDIGQHFLPNLSLFIPVVSISLYKYMDKLMLGNYSITEVGYYENVERLCGILSGCVIALGNVTLPRISYLLAHNETQKMQNTMANSMDLALFISIAFSFGLMSVSDHLIAVFFGSQFESCVILLMWLAPAMIIRSWANIIRNQVLIPYKMDKIYVLSVIAGATINVICNLIFIEKYGAMGAAMGTAVAELMVAFVQTYKTRKIIDYSPFAKRGMTYLCAGLSMYVMVKILDLLDFSIAFKLGLEVMIGAIIYLGASFFSPRFRLLVRHFFKNEA